MSIKIFGNLFFKINQNEPILDHIIICIYDLLAKHIKILVSTDKNQINIYNDIKTLIFQCVNKRYLNLENPTNIMKNFMCDCISILIISGITHNWENCIEDLILNTQNNNPELIYICIKSIADCDLIINLIKNEDTYANNDWNEELNSQDEKRGEIKEKLIKKSDIIFNFIEKVYKDINTFEKNLRIRLIKSIVDLFIFWTQLELNIFTNDSISNIIMELTKQTIIEDNPNNIEILKRLAELINITVTSSKNSRLYEFYGKIEENYPIEETLRIINENINLEEKIGIEKWLDFILNLLEQYKRTNNKNMDILWPLAKIFSSITENFIYLFFDLNNKRNVLLFQWVKNLISEKRIISWMFFSTIETMMNFITDYFRFYSYNDLQKKNFQELLIDILLNIMNNCCFNKINQNDFSQLQKEILFMNNEENWNVNKKYIYTEEDEIYLNDIDITEYRNSAENAIYSICLIFKYGFDSKECELIPFLKLCSLINLNNNNNTTSQLNLSDKNLAIFDSILFLLKSIIKTIDKDSSQDIIRLINDYIYNLLKSPYIQNINIYIDYLLIINQFSPFIIKDGKFKEIISNLLFVTQNIDNNQLLVDSCYIIISNLCRELKKNNFYKEYCIAFLQRYKILCDSYSLNNISQIENLIRAIFYCVGINEDTEDTNNNNEKYKINDNVNINDNDLIMLLEEILKPLLLINSKEKIKAIPTLKNYIIKSYTLSKEIFYNISLCKQNIRKYMLNYFISNTIDDLIELNKDSESNNIKIFNLFQNDEEIVNSILEFYEKNIFNIVEDCPLLIPKINEIFIELFKLNTNFYQIIDFFGLFYKYILQNTKEKDKNYIEVNKYVLDNFLLIIKLSINYLNLKQKLDEKTLKWIDLLLTNIIDVFPNIYIKEIYPNLFDNLIAIIQFIFNYLEFMVKEKREECYDRLISNIIKSLSSVLNNCIIKLISNSIQQEQKKELIMNIVYKTSKLLDLKEFNHLSIEALLILYYQMITFDPNLFIFIFSQLLISSKIFDNMYINNINNYLQLYYGNRNNIIDFIKDIINILLKKNENDCLVFYFNRLNTKKI